MSNPILNDSFGANERVYEGATMTVNGTLQNTFILGLIALIGAAYVWMKFMAGYTDIANALTMGGAIVGFVLALIVSFTRTVPLIPVYALAEGCALGGISAVFESAYPGIVLNAVIATFGALFTMLILYRAGIIKCTDKFRSVIFTATISVLAVYIINFIGSFFGYYVPGLRIEDSSPLSIGISIVITVIAALNLILDFDFIEKGTQMMLPKKYEWYGAFGLMVTLVWLYIEILKLLAKTQRK